MMQNLKFKLLLLLWTTALCGLAIASHFTTKHSGDVNFEIAIMLTPAGMINNFFVQSSHYLVPYYQERAAGRSSLFSSGSLFIAILIVELFSFYLLFKLKKRTNEP
jgi:hypothetical protein